MENDSSNKIIACRRQLSVCDIRDAVIPFEMNLLGNATTTFSLFIRVLVVLFSVLLVSMLKR